MYVLQKKNLLVIPRTELTYPAHTLKMHEKAASAPIDHVMPDFEDACPYEFKGDASRKVMVEALNTIDFGNKVIAIRPNNIRSKFFLGDVQAIMLGAPDKFHGIILPKTNEPEDIVHLSRLLDALEEQGGWTTHVQIEALIEMPLAVVNAYKIATASPRMAGLIFGIADFSASMGVREMIDNQNQNFHYAKQATVVAAKAAGLHAIDNAYLRLIRPDTTPRRRGEDQGRSAGEEHRLARPRDGRHVGDPPPAGGDRQRRLHAGRRADRDRRSARSRSTTGSAAARSPTRRPASSTTRRRRRRC